MTNTSDAHDRLFKSDLKGDTVSANLTLYQQRGVIGSPLCH